MNSVFVEKCTTELLKLYKEQHEVLYGGQHPLCLNVPCLLYLQRKFAQLQETSGGPIPPSLESIQTLRDHLSRTLSFKLIPDRSTPPPTSTSIVTISLEPFRALQILQMKRIPLSLLVGLQRLRGQLRVLVLHRCELEDLEDLVVRCGGDNSTSLAWGALKEIDLSNNRVTKLGNSLQYMHGLEKVNFSNNLIGKRPRVSMETSGGNEPEGSSPAVVTPDQPSHALVDVYTEGIEVRVVTPDQPSHALVDVYTEGIESIDTVQFLHLGFNKLRGVPRFGSRAKYNLRILNLRNNELVTIEGLEELDNLVELDLTDNLLSKHSSLKPFHNLHHLSVLALQGNPVVFHPKHRQRTAEHLSNLIEKSTFRLDGKKLSNAEKKVVPTTMTHYRSFKPHPQPVPPGKFFNTSINGITEMPLHLAESTWERRSSGGVVDLGLGAGSAQQATGMQNKKSRKTYTAVIVDSDDDQPPSLLSPAHNGDISEKLKASLHAQADQGKEELVVLNKHRNKQKNSSSSSSSSKKKKKKDKSASDSEGASVPPLINQEEIKRSNAMRKMIPDYWLQGSMDKSSSAAEEAGVGPSRGSSTKGSQSSSSHHNTSANSSDLFSSGTGSSSRQSDKEGGRGNRIKHGQLKENGLEEVLVDIALNECEGTFGPKTSSPDKASPVEIDGDHYLVERYESDVEDERAANGGGARGGGGGEASRCDRDQVILRLSDKFLDEIDSNGKFVDRWDLHSLLAVSVESKYWKPSSRKMEVLLLHFNLERRDRSRREYVLMEEGVGEAIMDTLKPVLQQNQFTLSMGNKLECLQCQRIFDRVQAKEQLHGDSPDMSHYSTSFNRKSISNLMCPYCHSQILQQSMRSSFKPGSHLGKLSQGSSNNGAAAVADPFPIYTSTATVHPGFEVVSDRSRTSVDERSTLDDFVDGEGNVQGSRFNSVSVKNNSGTPKDNSNGMEQIFGKEPHRDSNEVRVVAVNGEHSPTEGSYLQGFDDGSFAETEPATSTSMNERDPNTVTTTVATACSLPRNEDVLGPWVSDNKKPLNPLNDPDFQRYEGNLKSRSQQSLGGDSPDGFNGIIMRGGSDDEDKYRSGFGKGRTTDSDHGVKAAGAEKDSWVESRNFLDYDYPDPDPYFPSSDAIAVPPSRNSRFDADPFENPVTSASSSVPSQSHLQGAFLPTPNGLPEGKTERKGHGRSNSADLRKIKPSSSPLSKKRLSRGNLQDSDKSLTSVQEDNITSFENGFGNSRKGSLCSGESDSGAGSKSDSNSAANRVRKSSHGSGDGFQKGCSSGETSKQSKQKSLGSGEKPKEGSKFRKLSRVFSWNDLRLTTSPKLQNRKPSDKGQLSGSKSPGGGSNSSGSSSRKGSRKGSSAKMESKSPTKLQPHSSSDGGGGRERRAHSPIIIYKDDDPTYVHNSLQLYLDMEVLDGSREEKFKMVFRSSVVRYGEPGEVPVLVVISNIRAYLFRVIAPESSEPGKWLKLTNSHSLRKLVYIDHGVAYQYLRVEFKSPACYTFLLRNDKKCKLCSNLLSLCVADTPGSSLRNVGICVFNVEAIRHPEHILQEVVKSHYDASGAAGQRSPTMDRLSPTKHSATDNLLLYRLAFRRRQRTPRISPVTLVVTNNSLYLAKENFAHWPLPRIQALPPREALLPPYLDVEQKEIVDVERIVLDKEQVKFIVLCFFDETCNGGESCQWSLTLPGAECVTKLCDIIKTRWETAFETAVPVSYQ